MKIARKLGILLLTLVMLATLTISGAVQGHVAATYQVGDIFVSIENGQVNWYDNTTAFHATLNTGSPGTFTTGMAFDSLDNLYVTNFDAGDVKKFDNAGNLLGVFGAGYSGSPESILFNAAGHAYVGSVDGDEDIRKFDAAGNLTAQFNVATGPRGSDWIDLAADQSTMYYTSEGSAIHAYDVVTDAQLADFAPPGSLHGAAYALRILPNGNILVADSGDIHEVNPGGTINATWSVAGQSNFFALNLDPDGVHFWSADFGTANVYKFRLDTPGLNTQVTSFNTGTGSGTVFGLAIFGEPTAAQTPITVDKVWTNTNVCFERDNDADGSISEDPIDFDLEGNPIDNDGDGLFNEDPSECADGSRAGDLLPHSGTDIVTYNVTAVLKKNGTVSSYNPGQVYAVSTVNITQNVAGLVITENYTDLVDDTPPILALNPTTGGGRLVVVIVHSDGTLEQILDANSPEVNVGATIATVTLGPQTAGTVIKVYVKFGPGAKGQVLTKFSGTNQNYVQVVDEDGNLGDPILAEAILNVVPK